MQTVDVNIVTYNSKQHLLHLVDSLVYQNIPHGSISLHIIDNASQDGTIECLTELLATRGKKFAKMVIEPSETNIGFGRAHNRAAKLGSSPFILILNPDTELAPNCLSTLLAIARTSNKKVAAW
ncbi:unnamed protein product, partial [marine sediment metagenome]